MTALILHHYPSSPFSEKIRLVLGFRPLPWKSVVIPGIAPRPDVVPSRQRRVARIRPMGRHHPVLGRHGVNGFLHLKETHT
jgi:glutathione S-transferase